MGMSSGSSGNRAPLAEINVTPLVDVMLVLLIIFMVAAPMMTAGVSVDLPRAEAPRMEVEGTKLMISIDRQQQVFLGEDQIPFENLESVLTANTRIRTEKEVFIQADTAVPYGFVVSVMAILRKSGVEKLGLVTDPMGAGAMPMPAATIPAQPVALPSGQTQPAQAPLAGPGR